MTLFGLVWLIITSWCFIKKDIKYMFSITLLFMAFQSCNAYEEIGIGPERSFCHKINLVY